MTMPVITAHRQRIQLRHRMEFMVPTSQRRAAPFPRRMAMTRRVWFRVVTLLILILPTLLVIAGRAGATSILHPAGPRALEISNLAWGLMAIAALTVVLFIALFFVAASRRRDPNGTRTSGSQGIRTVAIGGALIPGIILLGVLAATIVALVQIAKPSQAAAATIDVVGHQWWWEVSYPNQGAVTANEIHIPVGEPVELKLTSDDVIHSFWVPELSDKLDMIPGKTNTLWLQADRAGEFRGQCAEFCGVGHALMAFIVIAQPPDQYNAWLAHQAADAAGTGQSSDALIARGQEVFFSNACVYCHAVRGTDARGQVGPDLTHLASREYLAAGTLPNTPGNLAGWILNPNSVKPGNLMPAVPIPADQLQALIAYLESLS